MTNADGIDDLLLMPAGKPDAEVDIDKPLIGRLLRDQHADLAGLPITHVASGWDNVIYRLGNELAVRLPRRRIAAQLLINEQTWLPALAPKLPIAIPAPARIGTPTDYYPWAWSVLPWLPGEPADLSPPNASQAGVFAEFLLSLHQPAPPDAPVNPVRGIALRVRAANTGERLQRLRTKTDVITGAIEQLWARGLAAQESRDPHWLHGDMHSQNVLVASGEISAIIDWGDITSGDVATDLAGIWMLFDDRKARREALEAYGPDQATLERAKGWAMMLATVLLDSGLINSPRHAVMGNETLRRLVEDA